MLTRQVHEAFDWVTGVQIEQVAHEQMARWVGNRLQAIDGGVSSLAGTDELALWHT